MMRSTLALMALGLAVSAASLALPWPWNMLSWTGFAPVIYAIERYRRWERRRAAAVWLAYAQWQQDLMDWTTGMKITLRCACGAILEVDGSKADEETREARLSEAAEWSVAHQGDGHGVGFNLPGVARGGEPSGSSEGTER